MRAFWRRERAPQKKKNKNGHSAQRKKKAAKRNEKRGCPLMGGCCAGTTKLARQVAPLPYRLEAVEDTKGEKNPPPPLLGVCQSSTIQVSDCFMKGSAKKTLEGGLGEEHKRSSGAREQMCSCNAISLTFLFFLIYFRRLFSFVPSQPQT